MNATLSIHVEPATGTARSLEIEGGRARIGSAAHCEIRLPIADAAPEHVALECSDGSTVRAHVLSQEPPPRIDGETFFTAELGPDSVLEIGQTKFRIRVLDAPASSANKSSQRRTSPLTYVVALLLVGYVASDFSFGSSEQDDPARQPPKLFAPAATCPQKQPERALAFGQEQVSLGDSKRERRPFRASDGVRAVDIYRVAAACLEVGGDTEAANATRAAAARLETELEESYRTHRVRLDHALSNENYVIARREARALKELTSGQNGEYVAWLASLDRRLKLMELEDEKRN